MIEPVPPAPAQPARQVLRGRIIIAALAVVLAGGIAYLVWLDIMVARRFEERRWTAPAQVYAQPLELFRGAALSSDAIEQELKRLGYRSASRATEPGTYRRRGDEINVMLRKARFGTALREAQPL